MKRSLLLAPIALALGLFAAGLCAIAADAAPSLRANVVVTGNAIRLGDLFSDAGPAAAAEIAPAPPLGGRTVLDAAWLAARAREQKLDWQPASRYDQITVERASQSVSSDAVIAALRQELASRLPLGQTSLTLDNADLRLFVAAGPAPTIALDSLSYDARSGRLSFYVAASAGDTATERLRVTGRVRRMLDMPVLNRAVAPGEMIAAQDVETIAVPADRLTQTYVAAANDLVGKTPKRSIRPGEPVRPSDVQSPVLVHKGDLITLTLRSPVLFLTAQGKALDDGAFGQAIRVSNTRSGKMLDAVVAGPGSAAIPVQGVPANATSSATAAVVAARQE